MAASTSSPTNTKFFGFCLKSHFILKLLIYCINIYGLIRIKLIIINNTLSFLCGKYFSWGIGSSRSTYADNMFS